MNNGKKRSMNKTRRQLLDLQLLHKSFLPKATQEQIVKVVKSQVLNFPII